MNRREFIQTTSMAAVGALTMSSFTLIDKKKIGLQLYSLRDILPKDPKGYWQKLRASGIKN
jgi:hypothetical protein